jgi:uncharacterized membrane protein
VSRTGDDRGQVTLLIIGFAVIVLLLIVVAINASRVFLAQRDLSAAADGASTAAAQSVSEQVVYGGEPGELLPIDAQAAAAAAANYLATAGIDDRFDDLALVSVTTDGTTVTVTLAARVHLPMSAVLPGDGDGSYTITSTASARSPFG